MAWRFVKQPSGLYARYSEIVDNFTDVNLKREAAVALGVMLFEGDHSTLEDATRLEAAIHLAAAKVAEADRHPDRWAAALEEIARVHGSLCLVGVLDEINGR